MVPCMPMSSFPVPQSEPHVPDWIDQLMIRRVSVEDSVSDIVADELARDPGERSELICLAVSGDWNDAGVQDWLLNWFAEEDRVELPQLAVVNTEWVELDLENLDERIRKKICNYGLLAFMRRRAGSRDPVAFLRDSLRLNIEGEMCKFAEDPSLEHVEDVSFEKVTRTLPVAKTTTPELSKALEDLFSADQAGEENREP